MAMKYALLVPLLCASLAAACTADEPSRTRRSTRSHSGTDSGVSTDLDANAQDATNRPDVAELDAGFARDSTAPGDTGMPASDDSGTSPNADSGPGPMLDAGMSAPTVSAQLAAIPFPL